MQWKSEEVHFLVEFETFQFDEGKKGRFLAPPHPLDHHFWPVMKLFIFLLTYISLGYSSDKLRTKHPQNTNKQNKNSPVHLINFVLAIQMYMLGREGQTFSLKLFIFIYIISHHYPHLFIFG